MPIGLPPYARPAFAFLGVTCGWAVQFSYCSPTLSTLGLSQVLLSYAWLIGPITGMVVQPLVGVYSDVHEGRWGRRRPFIAAGGVLSIVGLIGFSSARDIGLALGDDKEHPIGLALAVIFFCILDLSLNFMQGPLRALVCDVVEPRHHVKANSSFALLGSFGMALGYGLGIPNLKKCWLWSWASTQVMAVYYTAALVMIIAVSLGLQTPEKQYIPPNKVVANRSHDGYMYTGDLPADEHSAAAATKDKKDAVEEGLTKMQAVKNIYRALLHLPTPIARIFAVQTWAFFAWFTVYIYASDWMGSFVYDGSSNSSAADYDLYEDGVRAASLGFTLMSSLAIVLSVGLPFGIRLLGHARLYMIVLLCFGVILLNVLDISKGGSRSDAIFLLALLGIPRVAADSIPWDVTTRFLVQAHAFDDDDGSDDAATVDTTRVIGSGGGGGGGLGTGVEESWSREGSERAGSPAREERKRGSGGRSIAGAASDELVVVIEKEEGEEDDDNEFKSFVGEYHLNSGLFTAIFNISQCLMEFVVAIAAGPIAISIGGEPAALAMGGIGAFIGALLCLRVIDPPTHRPSAPSSPVTSLSYAPSSSTSDVIPGVEMQRGANTVKLLEEAQ